MSGVDVAQASPLGTRDAVPVRPRDEDEHLGAGAPLIRLS
jgi:hypothetical protein